LLQRLSAQDLSEQGLSSTLEHALVGLPISGILSKHKEFLLIGLSGSCDSHESSSCCDERLIAVQRSFKSLLTVKGVRGLCGSKRGMRPFFLGESGRHFTGGIWALTAMNGARSPPFNRPTPLIDFANVD